MSRGSIDNVVNECQLAYNDFMQLIADYQNHSGTVNTSTTPNVQYDYADGSANTIRPVTLTYPNGRVLTYDYGTADGINDAASRIASLIDDDDTPLVDYSFLGLGIIVVVDYSEPDVKYTLVDLSGTNDPDTGDIYSGLDRFGRVKDCRWYDYDNTTDTVRLKYGYDRASNRLWRADLIAQSLSKDFDELYSYDGLHRLKVMQRGLLNGSNTAVTNPTFGQCWSLDSTSNWHGFKEAATGGSWTLDQSRSANTVNEITGITNWTGPTWATPAADPAGNTTTIPQPADPTESFTATYDAWNRLVKLVDDGSDDTVQENQYDARTFRTVRMDYTSGTLSEERHLYYSFGWRCREERLGSSPDSADSDRQFVWGIRYVDDLVCRDRDRDANGSLDERLYGLQDANWNMVALIDASATAQERYLYSPFGWPTILDGTMSTIRTTSSVDIECLFTGQRFDWTTMLHLFRNRWLETITGRFINRDLLGYPDGPNAYAGWFAPNGVDPMGLKKCSCFRQSGPTQGVLGSFTCTGATKTATMTDAVSKPSVILPTDELVVEIACVAAWPISATYICDKCCWKTPPPSNTITLNASLPTDEVKMAVGEESNLWVGGKSISGPTPKWWPSFLPGPGITVFTKWRDPPNQITADGICSRIGAGNWKPRFKPDDIFPGFAECKTGATSPELVYPKKP